MFNRISQIMEGSIELARAEGELAISRARASLMGIVLATLFATLGGIGLLGLLAAMVAAMAQSLGWIGSLAIVSAIVLVVAAIATVVTMYSLRSIADRSRADAEARRKAVHAKQQLAGDVPAGTDDHGRKLHAPASGQALNSNGAPSEPARGQAGAEGVSFEEKAAAFIVENPAKVAGGALAVLAVLGPMRTLRYAGRAMLVGSLVQSIAKQAGDSGGRPGAAAPASSAPPPPPPHTPSPRPTAVAPAQTYAPVAEPKVGFSTNGSGHRPARNGVGRNGADRLAGHA